MVEPMKQYEVLAWASSFLKNHHREEKVAEILLQHHLNVSRATFFQEMQSIVPANMKLAFMEDIQAHVQTGIPVQHLIGSAPFYGREFVVNEHVLIPRFETEELVEAVMQCIRREKDEQIIVDVGTGSGIIAITLKQAFPKATVYAVDISREALHVAKQNARLHKAEVHFLQGNFLLPVIEKGITPNFIVSNPPYIDWAEKPHLMDTVRNFDPAIALFAEREGLAAYETIVAQSTQLNQDQLTGMYFEIGDTQKEAVQAIIRRKYPKNTIEAKNDVNGKNRIIITKW